MNALPLPVACVALAFTAACAPAADPVPTALGEYVSRPDDSFRWERAGKTETPIGTVHELKMTSQTWHGERWDHAVQVIVPTGTKPGETMLLYNTGGDPGPTTTFLGLLIAQKAGAPIAFLYNVPKQPLFGGKTEDKLIAETFVRYLDTGDATWPLLFPMVKGVVRGMDAVQAFAADEFAAPVATFVITGASKRGWTSWLTAATGDPRVKAIAPLVIDTLNMPAQMRNQVTAFGRPSEMIRDYTDRGLIPIPPGEAADKLWKMSDPWSYRSKLGLPKLIVNGANDRYWPLEALNSYWDDLPGEKYVLYVPNAGHNLEERRANGFKDRDRAVGTLAAFTRSQAGGKPMPKFTWDYANGSDLELKSDVPMKAVRLWSATSESRDFRQSVWTAAAGPTDVTAAALVVSQPASGFRAVFAEAEYERDGLTFTLSTQVRVLTPPAK